MHVPERLITSKESKADKIRNLINSVCSRIVEDNSKKSKPLDVEVEADLVRTLFRLRLVGATQFKEVSITAMLEAHSRRVSEY
jgi:hypothetical protein